MLFKVESHQDEINNNDLAYERHFREATHDIAQVQSTILRNKLIQDVANIFNMSPEMIYHEVGSNNMPKWHQQNMDILRNLVHNCLII